MSVTFIVDVIVAIAVSALLGEAYGGVRRKLSGKALAPFALGALFGVIALILMLRPIEPYDGLLIDLRNIPIALAGAFLGWRGLLPCLFIAASTRIGMGGIGATAGVVAMIMAGGAGCFWAWYVQRFDKRSFKMLLVLAIAMSSHLLAGFVLPDDLAAWFFTTAALPLFAMNLLAIPLIGYVLERENRRIQREHRMAAAMTRDPETGLLTGAAFVRDVTNAFAALPYGTFSGFLKISVNTGGWHLSERFFGAAEKAVLDGPFLAQHMEHAQYAGMAIDGSVLVPVTAYEIDTVSRVKSHLRLGLQNRCRDEGISATLQFEVLEAPDPKDFLRIAKTAAVIPRSDWAHQRCGPRGALGSRAHITTPRRSQIFNPEEHEVLFAKAEFLIERSST
ncbi:hypothetical protein KUL25_17475 [Rhodobacteraceae bacterium N5(2021)]|uniref:Signal transduction histidine kinase 5TM receptor LytS transmembrane region domain-containing protein n=1 Tax=Gymnodinialimonas phycosphaerae TaxID=2841589 RepID=A0A975YF89_9RHOB|nr:LytS/YhcK type 5TM receptor domain-containing protein [Gymnodinialimonas phycosphaerae]MBY4894552.1 hypothetical protein [Gymnodinialimonas phycosphaerae]